MTPFPHCDQLADKTLNKMRDSRYAGFKESAIGKKIAAGKAFIPYRDSKLTRIL